MPYIVTYIVCDDVLSYLYGSTSLKYAKVLKYHKTAKVCDNQQPI